MADSTHPISTVQDSTEKVHLQNQTINASSTQTENKTVASNAITVTNPTPVSSHHVSKLHPLVFPVRIGITWKKGEKLEAQDFSMTWYPSKIVEISEEEKAVLIHFEGWNQRYDEWVEMSSNRLRPCTRHSERKDKDKNKRRRVHPHPIYRPGDEILAKWKDCKKYPAKISRLMEESTYEVIFYDGVTHLINAINIQPMPETMKASLKNQKVPPVVKNKSSFKQVALTLPSSVRQRQESSPQKRSHSTNIQAYARKRSLSPLKISHSTGEWMPKVKLKRDRELDVYNVVGYKDIPDHKASTNKTPTLITCEATLSTVSEEECRRLFGEAALASDTSANAISEQVDQMQDKIECSSQAVDTALDTTSGMAVAVTAQSTGGGKPSSRVKKRAHTDTSLSKPSKKTKKKSALSSVPEASSSISKHQPTAKRPQGPPLGSSERSKSLDLPSTSILVPSQYFIPSKAFIIEEDHNPYKCPFEGCPKDFRKENLLRYHIKYYHTDQETTSTIAAAATTTTSTPVHSPHTPVQLKMESITEGSADASSTTGISERGLLNVVSSTAGSTPAAMISTPTTPLSPHLESQSVGSGSQRRRRRKTDSICSTDSEKSACSRGRSSSVRQRNDSEISVTGESPDVVGQEHLSASSRLLQDIALQDGHEQWENEDLACPDTEEADEEEMASDVVNCMCRLKHTQGLMIQCEVCLCWQHFKCADVKKTGKPPANYVCLICEQPPGARDSCKFMHDLGWERRGELPTYPFKQQSTSNPVSHLSTLACESNDLLTTLHGIKRALHSTRRQIKISKEEDDPEFQLWQTDWDNWTKPEEDLTMTSEANASAHEPSSNLSCGVAGFKLSANDGDKDLNLTTSDTTSLQSIHSSPLSSLSLQPLHTQTTSVSLPGVNQTMSSQQFSVSATPPKTTTQSTDTLADGSSSAALRSLASQANSDLLGKAAVEEETKGWSVSQLVVDTSHNTTLSTVSPSLSSLASPDANTTPPMMLSPAACPPATPASGRSSSVLASMASLTNNTDGKDSLVKDLFPGPAGDATSATLVTKETQGNATSSSPTSASETAVNAIVKESTANSGHSDAASAPHQGEITCTTLSDTSSLHPEETVTKEDRKTSDSQTRNPSNYQCESQPLDSHERSEQSSFEQAATLGRMSTLASTEQNQQHEEDATAGQQNGDLSPECTSPMQPAVNGFGHRGSLFMEDDEDTQDIDTDTAEESVEPYRHCEQNLLVHIQHVQSGVEDQLQALEDRIQELENSEHNNPQIQLSEENILNDVPALKKSLSKLTRYLTKVQHLSS